jgi:lipopolysaccharide export system permease protein
LIVHRYLRSLILGRIASVLLGFLALFALFDLVAEVKNVGQGSYGIAQAFYFIGLRTPSIVYELLPVCGLIGSLWALSTLATNSEFTVLRASGLQPARLLSIVTWISVPLVLMTVVLSELLVPWSESLAAQVKSSAIGGVGEGRLKSGYWLRDNLSGVEGDTRERMINLRGASRERRLVDVVLYEFDANRQLLRVVRADTATFESIESRREVTVSLWELKNAKTISFRPASPVIEAEEPVLTIASGLSPNALGALLVRPEQMSAKQLYEYARYLKESGQDSTRVDVALWRKLYYPFAGWIMLLLSLPAGYLIARGGPVGPKIFVGVIVGVAFHLLNGLLSHIGILTTLPAPLVTLVPSLCALCLALLIFVRVQRKSF